MSFTHIEQVIELIVNYRLTKYTSAWLNLRKGSLWGRLIRNKDIISQYFYEYLMHKENNFCSGGIRGHSRVKGEGSREEKNGKKMAKRPRGCVHAWRRLLQTGRTSLRVSLSQTNGLRLFDAVFHRNLLFIIPPARDDIEPCLLVVALMSLIAPPVWTEPPTTGSQQTLKQVPHFFLPLLFELSARKFHSFLFSSY